MAAETGLGTELFESKEGSTIYVGSLIWKNYKKNDEFLASENMLKVVWNQNILPFAECWMV